MGERGTGHNDAAGAGRALVLEADGAGDYRAPAGFADVHGACAMLGLSRRTLNVWQKQGRIQGVRWARYPEADKAGARRVYPVEALRGLVDPMRAAETFPPPGWVDGAGAAALLGIGVGQLYAWMKSGRLGCRGELVNGPNGRRGRIWPVAELERAAREMANPDGWVPTDEAAAVFGVSRHTFDRWVREGVVPAGRPGRVTNGSGAGRCLLYPLDGLRRIKAERDRALRLEPYPDPDRPGVWRVPLASDKHKGMEALIDEADLPLARGRRWNWSGGRAGGTGASVCRAGGGSLPRLIMGVADDPDRLVCYVNGDRLDLRRENLVVRTRSESSRAAKRPEKWDRVRPPYPDPDRPGVWRVPVCTDLHAGMEALIDEASLPVVRGKRLNWAQGKREGEGWVTVVLERAKRMQLHQAVMGVQGKEYRVGHLNGDPLDCRRENLVVRTHAQQKAATRKVATKAGRETSSRFKGVSRVSPNARWVVTISAGGEVRQLGRFRSEVGAALAYDGAAREAFGEHAALNFPDAEEAARMRTLAAEEEAAPLPPFPPPGWIDRRGACRMFGVAFNTWRHWECCGRVWGGRSVPRPQGTGRTKIYPMELLNRRLEEFSRVGKPYPDSARPSCYRVPIRSMIHRMEAIIDARDLPLVEGRYWNWTDRTDGRVDGQVILATTGRSTPLARIIVGATDTWETRVTHANGDPLDCRRANLVVMTIQEQLFSSRPMETRAGQPVTSKFKGVAWDESRGRWRAQIRKDGVNRFIGRFRDEIAAAEAYDEAARELFGEHAWLNFPDGVDAFLAAEAAKADPAPTATAADGESPRAAA